MSHESVYSDHTQTGLLAAQMPFHKPTGISHHVGVDVCLFGLLISVFLTTTRICPITNAGIFLSFDNPRE